MRDDPILTTWVIDCPDRRSAERVEGILQERTAPDAIIADTVSRHAEADESGRTTEHRLGDYFDEIAVVPLPEAPGRLRVRFRRRPNAGRFWKDVMVRVLAMAREASDSSSIKLESRD